MREFTSNRIDRLKIICDLRKDLAKRTNKKLPENKEDLELLLKIEYAMCDYIEYELKQAVKNLDQELMRR